MAASVRSFAQPARSATVCGQGRLSRNGPRRAPNTAGVASAAPGLASNRCGTGQSGRGVSRSPMPATAEVRPARQTGPSAPSPAARGSRSVSIPQSRESSLSAAAASAEPPPIPAATGRFFSSTSRAPCPGASARAARSTRLSASPASAPANGPATSRLSSSAGSPWSTSPASAKTTRLSSRCSPSARRPVTCR